MLTPEEKEELATARASIDEHVVSEEDRNFFLRLIDLERKEEAAKSEKAIDALVKVAVKWEMLAKLNRAIDE